MEAGFAAEDFTGKIRVPPVVSGGPDLFEEEYGQADVESAIAAFEKAHPEFEHAEEDATTSEMAIEETVRSGSGRDDEDHTDSPPALAGWLREEPEQSASEPARPQPAPAPFWVPREPEPELQPIPFAADDSASRHSTAPTPVRADEAPTQQIPLAAEFASLSRPGLTDPERITDETPRIEALASETPAPQAAPEAAPPAAPDVSVSREIEVLAETTSIRQLKEMLSSVSRPEGGLSDDEIDRLASRVVERLSEKIVREIAWEVIPDVAELVIKQRIKELEAGAE
jgi:hypothetical protein